MQLRFEGRVAVVTGAGRGLGRAYAVALGQRGGAVVINELPDGGGSESALSVASEVRAAGGQAVIELGNVADPEVGRRLTAAALDCFGGLDIVINNAGSSLEAPFEDLDLDAFREAVDIHLFGSAAVTHAAWPHLKAQGYARIVFTASAAGLWGIENLSPYCAGKAGVIGLAKSLAHEAAGWGGRVNVIAPGAKTRMSESLFEGRNGWTWRPELVAPAVLYLASEACRHNGAVLAAMAGCVARVESVQASGALFDPRRDFSPEDVLAALHRIDDLEGARPMGHGVSDAIRGAADLLRNADL